MGRLSDPFSMRFVLPEHTELLVRHDLDKSLVSMPDIAEDELDEFHYKIIDSIQYDYALEIDYFVPVKQDKGTIETVWGWVQKIEHNKKQIKLLNDEDYWWILLNRIVAIREKN